MFQRTATYSIPARNDAIDKEYVKDVKANYNEFRDLNRQQMGAFGSRIRRNEQSALEVEETERRQEFEQRWEEGGFAFLSSYNDFLLNHDANETVAEFVREKIYSIVTDPDTAKNSFLLRSSAASAYVLTLVIMKRSIARTSLLSTSAQTLLSASRTTGLSLVANNTHLMSWCMRLALTQ